MARATPASLPFRARGFRAEADRSGRERTRTARERVWHRLTLVLSVYEPSFKILFLRREPAVNRGVIHPHCAGNRYPVDGNVSVGKIASQQDFAEECVAEEIESGRWNSLEEFDGGGRDERDDAERERFLSCEQEGDEPVDRRRPEKGTTVLHNEWRQTDWNEAAKQPERNEKEHDRKACQ